MGTKQTINDDQLPATNLVLKSFQTIDANTPEQAKSAVQYVRDVIVPHTRYCETRMHQVPALMKIYKSTGIPPITFALAAALVALATVRRMLKKSAQLLSNLVGVVYPAYRSIKAIERPEPDDDERWLTYWPMFGGLVVLDSFSKKILQYVPVYFLSKMAVCYWLFGRNGALVVYRRLLRPLLVTSGALDHSLNGSGLTTPTAAHSRSNTANGEKFESVEPYQVPA
ncbi:ER membrane protein DP1/Yop1 [Quaeritorhiza haematococci]|nr:ER membrane protein DP1/Yop1 [Quaeritorhiza haematococci]